MAFTDKKLISARIKVLYPNTNLSQQRMNEISDRLSKKLADDADETAIDAVVNDANHYNPFSDIAKNDDKIRDLESKVKPTKVDDPPKPDPLPDDLSPAMKTFIENQNKIIEGLSAKVEGFATAQSQKSISERFTTDERAKNIPAFIRDKYIPTDDAKFEEAMGTLTTAYTEFAERHKLSTLGQDAPGGGGTGGAGGTPKIDPDLANFATKQNEAVTTK